MQKIYTKGRNLSEKERQNRINFIGRRLRKLEDNINNSGIFFLHLGVFFNKALQYWFELRKNKWRLSPGTALQVIKDEDPEYYKLLEVIFSNQNSCEEKIGAARGVENMLSNKFDL